MRRQIVPRQIDRTGVNWFSRLEVSDEAVVCGPEAGLIGALEQSRSERVANCNRRVS